MGKGWLVGALVLCAWGCSSSDGPSGPSAGAAGTSPNASAGSGGAGIDIGNAGDIPPKCVAYCNAEKEVCASDSGCEIRCASTYHARPNCTQVADAYFACAAANVVSCDPPGSFSFEACATEYADDEHCG